MESISFSIRDTKLDKMEEELKEPVLFIGDDEMYKELERDTYK